MNKTYKYFSLDNEPQEIATDRRDVVEISKSRCNLCGARLVVYRSDPHNVVECPNCYSDYDSNLKDHIEKLRKKLDVKIADIHRLNSQLMTCERRNRVYEKNVSDWATENH